MTTLKIDLDDETFDNLLDSAQAERRPIPWHAAVLLRRALNLPFPCPAPANRDPRERGTSGVSRAQIDRMVRP
jgi:hypothetical protein